MHHSHPYVCILGKFLQNDGWLTILNRCQVSQCCKGLNVCFRQKLPFLHPGPMKQWQIPADGRCGFHIAVIGTIGLIKWRNLTPVRQIAAAIELARSFPKEKVGAHFWDVYVSGGSLEEDHLDCLADAAGANLAVHCNVTDPPFLFIEPREPSAKTIHMLHAIATDGAGQTAEHWKLLVPIPTNPFPGEITLSMTIEKKWFDQILSRTKKIEFRFAKPRLNKMLTRKVRYNMLRLRNGYDPLSPVLRIELKNYVLTDFHQHPAGWDLPPISWCPDYAKGNKRIWALELGQLFELYDLSHWRFFQSSRPAPWLEEVNLIQQYF